MMPRTINEMTDEMAAVACEMYAAGIRPDDVFPDVSWRQKDMCIQRIKDSLSRNRLAQMELAAVVVEQVYRSLDRKLVGHDCRRHFARNAAEWIFGIPRTPCPGALSVLRLTPDAAKQAVMAGAYWSARPTPAAKSEAAPSLFSSVAA